MVAGGLVEKSCLTLATPWTVACQSPLSLGFSRREYWSAVLYSVSWEARRRESGQVNPPLPTQEPPCLLV